MPEQPPRSPIADAPLSVILLARAEDAGLEEVATSWSAFLEERGRPGEILLVQDSGSEPATLLADSLAERFPRLRVLRSALPRGIGVALQTGILAAQYPLLAYAPADQQFQATELKKLLARIDQVDLVTGYRVAGPVPSWLASWKSLWHWLARIVIGYQTERSECWLGWSCWWHRRVARWIFGVKVQDPECPFRLFRREVFRRLPIQSTSPFVHVEILAKANHLGAWMDQAAVSWTRPEHPAEPGLPRQTRRDAYQLFKNPDFRPVALKEPWSWPAPFVQPSTFRSRRAYHLPPDIADFALRYEPCLQQAAAHRMAEVGIPQTMIGCVPGDPGAFSNRHAVGGTNALPLPNQSYQPAINVDPAFLDTGLADTAAVPGWRTGTWKERLDAVIAHEYEEALAPLSAQQEAAIQRHQFVPEEIVLYRHRRALAQGPHTKLKISPAARQILAEYARADRV